MTDQEKQPDLPSQAPSAVAAAPTGKGPARKRKLDRLKAKISSGKYKVSNWELVKALFMSQ